MVTGAWADGYFRNMCCFTGNVEGVKNTRIFARISSDGTQSLIYQMALESKREVAMVLPIPVKRGSGEDALHFVSLESYLTVFDDLEKGFPEPRGAKMSVPGVSADYGGLFRRPLKVVSVGAYDASYVPSIPDFSRLDKRFRLPDDIWDQLPGYRDFGFAVFKLKRGRTEPHPMAFTFPTARPGQLFFPTLHIHHGKVPKDEEYDHTLYAQARGVNFSNWEESPQPASHFVKTDQTQSIVRADRHVYKRQYFGLMTNGDIVVKPRVR